MLKNIEDPLELANKLIEHELEILEGVSPHVFRDYIDTIRNTKPLAHMSPASTSGNVPFTPREDYPPVYVDDTPIDLATGQLNVREVANIRFLEHEDFIADSDFIASKEFTTFLYQYKGSQIRNNMRNSEEEKQLQKLQEEMDLVMREMTPEKGRQLLKDHGVLLYSGWDMNSALLFDGFLKKHDPSKQMIPKEIDKLFRGSGYDLDQKALL